MERLENLCYFNLVTNIHNYTPEVLSCLPTLSRQSLLTRLPVVDVAKLEDTTAVTDVDLNEVWKTICEIRLPQDMPFSLDNHGNWKDHFFAIVITILVNIFDANHGLYHYLSEGVYDLLFGFHNFLTVPKYSQFVVFLPDRYAHIKNTLSSASSISRYITDTCLYHPKSLYLSCSLFYYSYFFNSSDPTEGDIGSAFRELLGEVSELVISSDDAVTEKWDEDDDRQWEEQNQFHLGGIYAIETILSHKSPKLDSLIMTRKCNAELLDYFISALNLFCQDECQEALWRETITENLPYRCLKKISVSLEEDSEGEPSIFAPVKLASVIESQNMLETLQLTNWPSKHCFDSPSDRQYFSKLSSIFCNLLFMDQFSSLSLKCTAISTSDFKQMLKGLFHANDMEKILTLDSVDILHDMSNAQSVVEGSFEHLKHSRLHLRNMSFNGTSEQILYTFPLLKLKAFELDNVSPVPMVMFSECRDPRIQELAVANCVIPHSLSVNPLSVALGSCNLRNLHITTLQAIGASMIASLLTDGLLKNLNHIELQSLDLSGNNLGMLPEIELSLMLRAIFSLPCLNQMTLNISRNQFSSPTFLLANSAWKQKASGIRLKVLICFDGDTESEYLDLLKEIAIRLVF